ncbi:Fe-Mn family superoxide dismutase [Patescibacteria group bacterium]|nr:Fe-Mn family superoxide dismutase [Patescibacteria group bacterium]
MYTEKVFQLASTGLSDGQMKAHLGLYSGYVKNVNLLLEEMRIAKGPALSEISRRFSFEFNGMRLHEYYFEQFEAGQSEGSTVKEEIAKQFGSFDVWKEDFIRIGSLRGIGWAILVEDERTGRLMNIWVSDHEVGHLGGQKILLAMDAWEHAYLLDMLPSERAKYINLFFEHLNWDVVEGRK